MADEPPPLPPRPANLRPLPTRPANLRPLPTRPANLHPPITPRPTLSLPTTYLTLPETVPKPPASNRLPLAPKPKPRTFPPSQQLYNNDVNKRNTLPPTHPLLESASHYEAAQRSSMDPASFRVNDLECPEVSGPAPEMHLDTYETVLYQTITLPTTDPRLNDSLGPRQQTLETSMNENSSSEVFPWSSDSTEVPCSTPIPAPRNNSLPGPIAVKTKIKSVDSDSIYEAIPWDSALRNLPDMPIPLIDWISNDADASSTTSEPCSWLDEPLYQFTSYYESVPEMQSYTSIEVEDDVYSYALQSDASTPRVPTMHKTSWRGVARVINTNVLGKLSKLEIAVQEVKFEILTSEASFFKSLTTLKKHFITSQELTDATNLLREDHSQLFSLIKPIQKASKAFLSDLDKCWKRSIFLQGIFDVIVHHAKKHFTCYVTYCTQLDDIREKLKTLTKNRRFAKVLSELETSDRCGKLPLYTFLSIPMKRIVSLNLLLTTARAVMLQNYECNKSFDFETELGDCLSALDCMQELCKRSDRGSQTTNRIKRLFDLQSKLKYPLNILQLSIISPHRWLVMHGDVKLHGRSETSSMILKKTKNIMKKSNSTLRLYLLNDIIILTKPCVDGYKVKDYCSVDKIQVASPNIFMGCNPELVLDGKRDFKILLILQSNHDNKRVEMVLSCTDKKDRDIWVKALSKKQDEDTAKKSFPRRMVCVYPFHTFEDEQVALLRGDEVIANKCLENGWFEGVRTRGNKSGSFPPSRVEEATSVFPLVEIFN